jgi:hypothetical protein
MRLQTADRSPPSAAACVHHLRATTPLSKVSVASILPSAPPFLKVFFFCETILESSWRNRIGTAAERLHLRLHIAVGQDCMPGGTTSGRWQRSASPRASGTAVGSSPACSRPCCSSAWCITSSATGGCGSLTHLYQASVPLWMVSDSMLALVLDLLDNDKIIRSINDSLA